MTEEEYPGDADPQMMLPWQRKQNCDFCDLFLIFSTFGNLTL